MKGEEKDGREGRKSRGEGKDGKGDRGKLEKGRQLAKAGPGRWQQTHFYCLTIFIRCSIITPVFASNRNVQYSIWRHA